MEEAIMPILADFKPDLIINSAGQDNHFSDPITDMRFSAQGYAKLNDMLSPDIAVLEGGYSIEKALPYVNVGIILAMAGLDYSYVKEPEYDHSRIRQSDEISRYVAREAEEIYELWSRREEIRKKAIGNAKYFRQQKNIYYDTDGISEQQEIVVRICNDCGGMVAVDSRSSLGNRIFAVAIPWHACPVCRREGEEAFEKAQKKDGYRYIYLQDKDKDLYLVK
jgi:hypothetical protein